MKITKIRRNSCTELSVFKRILGVFLFGLAAIFGSVITAIPYIASVPLAIAYLGIQCRLWS